MASAAIMEEEYTEDKLLDKWEWTFLPFLNHLPFLPELDGTTKDSLARLAIANRMRIRRHFLISKLIMRQEEKVTQLTQQYAFIDSESRETWEAFCYVVKKHGRIMARSRFTPKKKITHFADPKKYGRATPRCQRERLKDANRRTVLSERKMQSDFCAMLAAKRRLRVAEAELKGFKESLAEDEAGWASRVGQVVEVVEGDLGPD